MVSDAVYAISSLGAPVLPGPEYVVTIDDYWLTFAVSVALPVLVALVTQRLASGAVKSLVLLFLSLVTGFATSLFATDGTFELKSAGVAFAVSFVTAVAAHFGLLGSNGLNLTGKNGAVATALPSGVGKPVQ